MPSTKAMLLEVQQKLKTALPNLSVELFPENPDQYRLNHSVGAVLISYSGAHYQGDDNTVNNRTLRTLRLDFIVIMRSLNDDQGALTTLDQLRQVVQGLRLTDAWSPIKCINDKFLVNFEGTWRYLLSTEFTQFI